MTNPFGKPLRELTEADLEAMIGDPRFREGQYIDYKREVRTATDTDKEEFIKDVSAFANSFGGLLVVGVKDVNGLPETINGVEPGSTGKNYPNFDKLITGFQQIINDHTDPRLSGVQIIPVSLKSGKSVLIFDIPKSPLLPHRNRLDGKFYYRYDSQSREMTTAEIRALMVNGESFVEKVKREVGERVEKIRKGRTPVPLQRGYLETVLHVIPESSMDARHIHDWSDIGYEQGIPLLDENTKNPLYLGGIHEPSVDETRNKRIDETGFWVYGDHRTNENLWYVHLTPGGWLEAVDNGYQYSEIRRIREINPNNTASYREIRSKYLCQIIQAIERYRSALSALEIPYPYWVSICLAGASGWSVASLLNGYNSHPISSDRLLPDPVILHGPDTKVGEAIRPIMDHIWQAAGYPKALVDD